LPGKRIRSELFNAETDTLMPGSDNDNHECFIVFQRLNSNPVCGRLWAAIKACYCWSGFNFELQRQAWSKTVKKTALIFVIQIGPRKPEERVESIHQAGPGRSSCICHPPGEIPKQILIMKR